MTAHWDVGGFYMYIQQEYLIQFSEPDQTITIINQYEYDTGGLHESLNTLLVLLRICILLILHSRKEKLNNQCDTWDNADITQVNESVRQAGYNRLHPTHLLALPQAFNKACCENFNPDQVIPW